MMDATTEKADINTPQTRSARRRMPIGDLFKPHEPIPRGFYVGTAFFSLVLIFGTWAVLSYSGIVKPSYFLPTPTQVFNAGLRMVQTGELIENAQASIFRVVVGW